MTRPRPSIGPAMAGAVDLSGLKQRAQQPATGAATAPTGGVEVTEANFEAEVLVRSGQVPVVVVLWSPRSDASVQLSELLGALAADDNGKWSLATVNVDVVPRVAQMFGIEAVPTVVALAGGQPLASFQGMQPPEQLRRWVDSLLAATAGKLPGAADSEGEEAAVDPALAQAREHLEAGDFAAATAAYQAILDADPGHTEAKGALRQMTFLERATAHRPDVVAASDGAPDDIEAAFAAADVQILNQEVVPAFDRLIALVRKTSGDDRTKVRTRLIELFELFDPADPDVITGRRNLANALY
ncbi:tetratricopeptide repeat protein [Mycobacterium sp. CVI_P3]|uniref:Tetratricopeptide repeat protein n=1 Tax=Mycobacterium pinniadriaticum TaxID=2994102 RepID=A0ABT3SR73_9MYCO|nr:tetratricopeptide repeat protein [Mycobacterium pinniadriaticum]MCX2934910.1 tetratricopeptide repeat protein [Mycobacterium pinniadriaticum]MCX2941332.1 tetratricopeptide repeat protein [Mycobacterium pinniadriaticum]